MPDTFRATGRLNRRTPDFPTDWIWGFRITLPFSADAEHDISMPVAGATFRDWSDEVNIIASSAMTKRCDAPWAAGTAQGGLGTPALNVGINVTFSRTANPDTITAASGTPFAGLVVGDTIIVTGSASNNGTYQVVSATDTIITLGNDVLVGDEGPVAASIYVLKANTTYHVHVIATKGGDSFDFGIDTSSAASNLRANADVIAAGLHVAYRWVGILTTDASGNINSYTYLLNDGFWSWGSSEVPLSASTNLTTWTHPFSVKPLSIQFHIEFDTGVEGWSVNDRLYDQDLTANSYAVFADDSVIGAVFNSSDTIAVLNKSAFTGGTPSVTNFFVHAHARFFPDAI